MIKPKMSELVRRSYPAEFRADAENGIITGVPIVFGQNTDIGGWFEERIEPGAIDPSILKDVAFYYNHDIRSKPMARTRTGKLILTVTDAGVPMEAHVNRERTDVNDLYLAIKDGDIDGMSFAFRVEEERWERLDTDYPLRIITKIGYVQEVSAVNYPAYSGTSINARSDKPLDSDKQMVDTIRAAALDRAKEERQKQLELAKAKALAL